MQLALFMVGGFYVFAGVLSLHFVLRERLIDQALAQLTLEPRDPADRARTLFGLGIAALTYLSGLLLVARLELALWVFLACTALQLVFLLWSERQARELENHQVEQKAGRRSWNALIIYTLCLVFVGYATFRDMLQSVSDMSPLSAVLMIGFLVGFAAYAWIGAGMRRFPL